MLPLAARQRGGEPGRALYLRDLRVRAGCARSKANHLWIQTSQKSLIFWLEIRFFPKFSGCSPELWIQALLHAHSPERLFFFFFP